MLNQVVLRETIYVVFFLLIFAVKPAMSECPNIQDIKIVKSFGIEICAMPKVDDKYLNHAKKIMDKLGQNYPVPKIGYKLRCRKCNNTDNISTRPNWPNQKGQLTRHM